MTTLIEARGGDGRLLGRCDAKCYNAAEKRCECICGGKNHGVGKNAALENATEEFAEVIKAIREDAETVSIPDDPHTRNLEFQFMGGKRNGPTGEARQARKSPAKSQRGAREGRQGPA